MEELKPCPCFEIPLSKEKVTHVSPSWYNYLSIFKWYASQTGNKYYAARTIDMNGKKKIEYMHRVIMRAGEIKK